MANTEILTGLRLVREAKDAVHEAMDSSGVDQQATLEELSNCLEEIEGDLIASALEEKIKELQEYKKELETVNSKIDQNIKNLKAVSDKVAKAAQALGMLVNIVGGSTALKALIS